MYDNNSHIANTTRSCTYTTHNNLNTINKQIAGPKLMSFTIWYCVLYEYYGYYKLFLYFPISLSLC